MDIKFKDNSKLIDNNFSVYSNYGNINTKIYYSRNLKIVSEIYYNNDISGAIFQSGNTWGPEKGEVCLWLLSDGSGIRVRNLGVYEADYQVSAGWHIIEMCKDYVKIDGVIVSNGNNGGSENFPIYIGQIISGPAYIGIIKNIKIFNNDILIGDYIGVKYNNEFRIKDNVSGNILQMTNGSLESFKYHSRLPETVFLKTTTFYHKNTPNVDGLQLLNSIFNYQKTHQDEIKEYYYPTTQLWQDIITEYPDIIQYYNINHKLCIPICEADDPEQFTEDFIDAADDIQQELEDYPDLIPIIAENISLAPIIAENPEIVHSLIDTDYETVLTSSKTQYIDTGFKPNQDTRVVIEFNDLNQNVSFLFGSRTQTDVAQFGYINGIIQGQGGRYGAQEVTLEITHNIKLTLDANKTYWTLSNGNTATFNNETFQSTQNFALFGFNSGGTITCVSIKVYSCKIYDNDILIRWLVPIQNNGNPCMIDLLTGTKYLNQGTGSFTYSLEPKNT